MDLDTSIRELVREVVREELGPLREELRTLATMLRPLQPPTRAGDLLSVEDVAKRLKVSQSTVREWIKSGALNASRPAIAGKAGRIYRIAPSDLDSFLADSPGPAADMIDIKAEARRIIERASRKQTR
jgi:excisionase family DNA binding protein